MADFNSTTCLDLLGKSVCLIAHIRHPDLVFDVRHRGVVIAVVVPLPGSSATASILLDEGDDQVDYFDLCDVTIASVA